MFGKHEAKPVEAKAEWTESLTDEQLEQASGGCSRLEKPDDGHIENDENAVIAHMRPSHLA